MKKLLGLLFCFGFLLMVGTTEAKAQTEPNKSTYPTEVSVEIVNYSVDMPSFNIAQAFELPSVTYHLPDVRNSLSLGSLKSTIGLRSEQRFNLHSPVIYLNKQKYRFGYGYTHYNYKPLAKPIWQPNFSI